MKKLLLLLVVIPLLSFTTKQDQFSGRWVGDDQGKIGYINFEEGGFASFEIQGQIYGGKEFEMKGEKAKFMYEVNQDTDPTQVDFIMTIIESGEQKSLLCIANIIDTNTMQLALNFNNVRPTSFDTDETILFKRETK